MSNLQQIPTEHPPPPSNAASKNGFGLAALILGIVALAGAAIPLLNYAAIAIGAIGVVLGIIGLLKKFRPRRAAIAGTILSALGFILSIIMVIVYAAIFFGVTKAVDDQKKASTASHSVVYSVTGDSKDAMLTYSTDTNGNLGQEQATNQKLPFSKTLTVKGSTESFSFNSFVLSGTNGATGTAITCKITVDGKVVSTQTSKGAGATAMCSGSN